MQTVKGSISEAMKGMQKKDNTNGFDIYKVKAWDYAGMCEVFEAAIQRMRETHIPALFHVEEVTQPQGHSTSGSHERYKSPERLRFEEEYDCVRRMREWLLAQSLASREELAAMEQEETAAVRAAQRRAWDEFQAPIRAEGREM